MCTLRARCAQVLDDAVDARQALLAPAPSAPFLSCPDPPYSPCSWWSVPLSNPPTTTLSPGFAVQGITVCGGQISGSQENYMVQNWRKSNSSLCHLSLESPKRPTPNSKTFYGTSCPSRAAHLGSARSAARPSSVTASTARPSTALFTASRRYTRQRGRARKSLK